MNTNLNELRTLIGYRVEYRGNGDWKVLTRAAATKEGERYARERAAELAAKSPETWVRVLRVWEAVGVAVEWNTPAPTGGGTPETGKGGACGWG